jgi:hypothetical protein
MGRKPPAPFPPKTAKKPAIYSEDAGMPLQLIDSDTLYLALEQAGRKAEAAGKENRFLAARRIMADLRAGTIQEVAEALLDDWEPLITQEDEEEDET